MSYVGKGPIDRTLGLSQKNTDVGDGSTTSFDILTTAAPSGGDTAVDVFVDNVRQEPGVGKAYVLAADGSGDFKRITFSTAPASGAVIWTNNRLRTQITNILPSSATVTGAMLNDDVVTGQTALGTTPAAADALLIYDDSASALKKVTYANFGGDISSVVAGTGLSGGGTSGAVTLNVEAAQTQITSLGTIASLVATTADINAGTFDGIVGGTTPAAGTFTTFTSTGIDDNSDAVAITIDSSEKVGIGTTSPGNFLDVRSGSGTPATPHANDVANFFKTSTMAITLGTDTAGETAVLFGDTDARHRGAVKYQHSTDAMLFDVNGSSEKLRLASAGQIGIGGANYGTSGQVLTSAGASAAPSWADTVGGPAWTLKTAAYTAETGDGVMVDTDSSAITITLPLSTSPPALGDFVRVMDATGNAATNNITVARNGNNIQGAAADLTIATNRASIGLVYVNGTEGWVLIEN